MYHEGMKKTLYIPRKTKKSLFQTRLDPLLVEKVKRICHKTHVPINEFVAACLEHALTMFPVPIDIEEKLKSHRRRE